MKTITIQGITPELEAALRKEKQRRGESMNRIVLDLMQQGLGLEGRRSNGLAQLGGDWTEDEFPEFEQATEVFEQIDEELWGSPRAPSPTAPGS